MTNRRGIELGWVVDLEPHRPVGEQSIRHTMGSIEGVRTARYHVAPYLARLCFADRRKLCPLRECLAALPEAVPLAGELLLANLAANDAADVSSVRPREVADLSNDAEDLFLIYNLELRFRSDSVHCRV